MTSTYRYTYGRTTGNSSTGSGSTIGGAAGVGSVTGPGAGGATTSASAGPTLGTVRAPSLNPPRTAGSTQAPTQQQQGQKSSGRGTVDDYGYDSGPATATQVPQQPSSAGSAPTDAGLSSSTPAPQGTAAGQQQLQVQDDLPAKWGTAGLPAAGGQPPQQASSQLGQVPLSAPAPQPEVASSSQQPSTSQQALSQDQPQKAGSFSQMLQDAAAASWT